MHWSRLRLSRELTFRLRDKKARTGLTPNLLCRLGFCLSLADPQVPDPAVYDEDGLEFNRLTLVGEWDELFAALLRQRLVDDGLHPIDDFVPQLRAHMNRGAEIVCNRVRALGDIVALVPRTEHFQPVPVAGGGGGNDFPD
jgi:DNA sulfur modification protein DndE